jgi:hypothetical protein
VGLQIIVFLLILLIFKDKEGNSVFRKMRRGFLYLLKRI